MNNNYSPQMPPVGPSTQSSQNPVLSHVVLQKPVRSGDSSLLKTVIIILLSLLLVAALLLSYYFFREYRVASSNVNQQIDAAVSEKSIEIENALRAEYDEKEKQPYDTFTGPADFGSLSFEYPKTWSVYVENDAADNRSFTAYLHPNEIPPLKDTNPIALTVKIETDSYESFIDKYSRLIKDGKVKSTIIKINGEDATRLDGQFSNTSNGSLVIIKIRDKVASLLSNGEIYRADFDKIIETITFNQ
ncbi:hypothetical protein IKF81_03155 [Candidatus Saccharibacteria bacterium]|nr:hypothetical protein [Candidatus Saccharibacteria bacterium]